MFSPIRDRSEVGRAVSNAPAGHHSPSRSNQPSRLRLSGLRPSLFALLPGAPAARRLPPLVTRHWSLVIRAAALPLAALLTLSACAPRQTPVERGNATQTLHRGVGAEVADLDPHLATGLTDYAILTALLEGLVAEDPVDLHPVPGVAERWEISPDALTYTFHLRENARWSNATPANPKGDPVTAADFVASFRRILTPSLGAEYAPLLYVIQNAEPFHKGAQPDFAQVGVTAPDARTLRITLEHPTAHFLAMLNHTAFLPVHLPTLEKHGSGTQRGNPWARPGRFVGNGPFTLAEWKAAQRIVVKKSPTYWDAATVRLNEIHFHVTESRDAEERAFRAGQLHLTEALPPSKVETYRRENPAVLRIDPYLGTEFYRLNLTRPFLNDRRIRRALAQAIDRTAIVEKITRGGQQPAHAFTPAGITGYAPAAFIPTDFNAARTLLAEAGYPGGKGAPIVELLYNTSESHRAVAEAVQEMWRRELGLEVRLINQELKTVQAARRTGDFQVLRSVWNPDYLDPLSFLEVWTTSSGNNYTGWSNRAYDQLLFQAARTANPAARLALFQQAEALLLDDAPFIPIYHYTHVFLLHPSVKGWHPTILDHHPYKHVYLEN